MLEKMAREYTAIVRHLLKQPEPWIKKDRLLVSRETLVAMLDKHPYLTATDKLTTWRNLHWIDADSDGEHFTKRVRKSQMVFRVVFLNLTAYKELSYLRQKDAK